MDMLYIIHMLNEHLYTHIKKEKFSKLKTDEERVIFALNILHDYDDIFLDTLKFVERHCGMPKNAKKSEELREDGNKIFVKGGLNNITCVDALKLYTKSIAFAPYPSEQLALAYANRSAVLFHLGLHVECVLDIDRALTFNYPDNLKAKLYIRKTECLLILKSCSTEHTLKEAQHWLEMYLKDKNQEKLRAKLDILHRKTVQTKLNVQNPWRKARIKEPPLPTIIPQSNEVSCASDAVAIKYNKRYGRHVVATRNLCPGEVIAVEKPYSMMLLQENMQTHCSNCLRVCWANIPCNYCIYVMYCSEECKYAAWKKCHDLECAVFACLPENTFSNCVFFSLRLAILAVREAGSIQQLRIMLQEVDNCDDPRTKGFSHDGKLHSDRYISIYSLITNTEKRTSIDLFRQSVDTALIVYSLATRTAMFGTKQPENVKLLLKNKDVTFIGALIMRHLQILPCNVHIIQEEQGWDQSIRGVAAMPFFSLFNHSCDPNILRHSRDKHAVMVVIYPIKKGEQLLDNYGGHYAHYSREFRQKDLLERYYFTCDCIACQENWPFYIKLQSYNTLVKKSADKIKIQKVLRKLSTYVIMAAEDQIQGKPYVIKDLLMMVQVLHECAPLPCLEMFIVIKTLMRVYNLIGNRFEIPKVWKSKI